MRSHDFLACLHEALAPPTYLEIGVGYGDSLVLSRARTIAVDPAPSLSRPLPEHAVLFEETSDAFFARERPLEPFGGRAPALALIDGMHLFEYALRDFINVERRAHWTSVIVFDDVFPRTVEEAARERSTKAWAGDVFKVLATLARHRRDLITLPVHTRPTGLLLVVGLDPRNRVLRRRYERIVRESVVPDPQPVPSEVLERGDALAPEDVLSTPAWGVLRDARERDTGRWRGLHRLRAVVREDLGR